jgi:hypothetical protein
MKRVKEEITVEEEVESFSQNIGMRASHCFIGSPNVVSFTERLRNRK